MRIVYDDSKAKEVVELYYKFLCDGLNSRAASEYDYGMYRIQRRYIIAQLEGFLKEYGFSVGKRVYHANGIGNNGRVSIFYNAGDEMQECCYFNCNIDPFGVAYISLEDYNGKLLTGVCPVSSGRG